jgi:hypothetical protein
VIVYALLVLYLLYYIGGAVILTKYTLIKTTSPDGRASAYWQIASYATVRSNAMFADSQTLTINTVANVLAKTSINGSSSVYTDATGNLTMTVSHSRDKRRRSVIRIDQKKVAADPLLAERNVETSQSAYIVLNAPVNGLFSNTEQKYLLDALNAYMAASAGANTTKFVNGES